jgi:hypothetical protein
VNPALTAFAATVTELGIATEGLLVVRLTFSPEFGAAAVNVTVQASVPDPVIDALVQVRELSAAWGAGITPVPLRLTTVVPFEVALLTMEICPEAGPAAAGANSTFTLKVSPAAMVIG